jgi:parallel beta-helix repeat protein
MPRRLVRVSAALIVPLSVGIVLAAEGRTPVFAPGTFLGADGKYIVTRNLAGGAGAVITIGGPNVDLDLNGFVLTGGGAPVISVAGGVDHVTIHNGVLSGGTVGIDVPGPTRKVDIEDVKIHGTTAAQGIHLGDVEGAALRRNEITDTPSEGIAWDGGAFVKHGTIENNLLRRTSAAIVITSNCSSIAVVNNRIEEPGTGAGGAFPGNGIVLAACGASLVSENTVEHASVDGIRIVASKGNKLLDNVVRACGGNGIFIDPGSTDTLVLNNVASGNGTAGLPSGGSGLMVAGTQNLIERNLLNTNSGFGLQFCAPGASCSNTFGRNMARGNTGAVVGPCGPCGGVPALFPPNSCNIAGCPAATPNSTFGDNLIPGPPIF